MPYQFKGGMTMTIATHTPDRKALAKAIAEELGVESRYMGPPTFCYQVGDFKIDREANIIGEDFGALREFLARHEFITDDTIQNTPGEPEVSEEPGTREEAPGCMYISVPAQDITPAQLKNLAHMLYSRQSIINRMTQSECLNIPATLIGSLHANTPETIEDFIRLLDDSKADGLTGFDYRDGKVTMAFPFDETAPERWTTYGSLMNRIYDAAVKAKRVIPERTEPNEQNEKYLAHTFLQRLGFAGADSKAERKILLGHLRGYCAFANGDKMQAHKEKYTAIRQERRLAEHEAAVVEVMADD